MKKGDLVKGKTFDLLSYGYGMIMDVKCGSIAVLWPKEKIWSYVSYDHLELVNESR